MLLRTVLRMRKSYYESRIIENWNKLYSKETTVKENKKLERQRDKLKRKLTNVKCKLSVLEKKVAA